MPWVPLPYQPLQWPVIMAERTAVQCEDCGQGYTARLIRDDVILPTDDGKCVCGSNEFTEVQVILDTEKETIS